MADIKATTAAPKTTIGSALTKALQQKKTKEAVAATTSGGRDTRQPMTLERARALAPHLGLMENIARSFPLDAMSQETAEEVYNELRDTMRAQINAQADINFYQNWEAFAAVERDLQASRMLDTEYGLGYEDECLAISLAYRRKYTSDTVLGVPPSTSVVLHFSLKTGDQPVQPFSLFPRNVFNSSSHS